MDLRFPAPSSNDPVPPGRSGSAAVPFESSSVKGASALNPLAASLHRVADARTLTSVAPIFRPLDKPTNGDLPIATQGTDPDTRIPSIPNAGETPASSGSGPGSAPADSPAGAAASSAGAAGTEPTVRTPRLPKLQPRRHTRVRLRHLLPAWSVSLLVHVVILSALAAATFTAHDDKKAVNFDSALAGYRDGEKQDLNVLADPADIPRTEAVGKEHGGASPPDQMLEMASDGAGDGDNGDGGGMVVAAAFGGGAASATPRFRGTGRGGINEANSLPNVKLEGIHGSPLNMLPAAPAADLYGGGRIAGDPTFDVQGIGPALDQLAREILRHLKDHKLTVVWLFDESRSMQDDQRLHPREV